MSQKNRLNQQSHSFLRRKKLVTPPIRTDNGYRSYSAKHIEELTLLRQARQVGFTLDECRELLALFHNPARHSADVKAATLLKVAEIEQHIDDLNQMRLRLLALADECPGDDGADCPIINNLSGCCHSADKQAVDNKKNVVIKRKVVSKQETVS